ncbi:hypothetical protein [Arthrobacter sp. R4-81]
MDGNPDAETALALTWDVLEAADQALGPRRKPRRVTGDERPNYQSPEY